MSQLIVIPSFGITSAFLIKSLRDLISRPYGQILLMQNLGSKKLLFLESAQKEKTLERKWKAPFLCTANSARSQMAEGFLKSWGEDRFEVYSAGISVSAVNPLAVKVMDEVKIDISAQKSKSVGLFLKENFDYIIIVCDNAKEVCPNFPGEANTIH